MAQIDKQIFRYESLTRHIFSGAAIGGAIGLFIGELTFCEILIFRDMNLAIPEAWSKMGDVPKLALFVAQKGAPAYAGLIALFALNLLLMGITSRRTWGKQEYTDLDRNEQWKHVDALFGTLNPELGIKYESKQAKGREVLLERTGEHYQLRIKVDVTGRSTTEVEATVHSLSIGRFELQAGTPSMESIETMGGDRWVQKAVDDNLYAYCSETTVAEILERLKRVPAADREKLAQQMERSEITKICVRTDNIWFLANKVGRIADANLFVRDLLAVLDFVVETSAKS